MVPSTLFENGVCVCVCVCVCACVRVCVCACVCVYVMGGRVGPNSAVFSSPVFYPSPPEK